MSLEELSFSDVSGAVMEIEHPATGEVIRDTEGNPAWIRLLSTESDKGVKINNKIMNQNLESMQKKKGLSAEKTIEQTAELLAELTEDWYLVSPKSGEPIDDECNKQNARKAYRDNKWLRDQAEDFAADLGNFTEG
jgi:hypothetical protein